MNHGQKQSGSQPSSSIVSWLLLPLKLVAWPFLVLARFLYEHWLSYVLGRVQRDEDRVYSVRFVWYGDSIYLHPLVWGSLVLFFVVKSAVFAPGWPLLVWFMLLAVCFLTVIYNFNIVKAGVLIVCIVAVLSLAYISSSEWKWNPLRALADHIEWLHVEVTQGFYIVAAYVFTLLISAEVVWAWLFNRVEIDEAYVYERRFLQSTTREPIFARGLKRETKDLLELVILGAADITHRTQKGSKVFKNVPGASLGLGTSLDKLLDHRRPEQIRMERKRRGGGVDSASSDGIPDAIDDAAGNE